MATPSAVGNLEEFFFSFLPFGVSSHVFNRNRPELEKSEDEESLDKQRHGLILSVHKGWERPKIFDKAFDTFWHASRLWRWLPLLMSVNTFIVLLVAGLYRKSSGFNETSSPSSFEITRAIFLSIILVLLPLIESIRFPFAAQVGSAGLLVVCTMYLEGFLQTRQCLTAFFASVILFRLLHFRTVYDNFALCIAYTANIEAVAVSRREWYLTANLLVWSSFSLGILFNYITYRVYRRVYENLHGLHLIREKTNMNAFDRRREIAAHYSPAFDLDYNGQIINNNNNANVSVAVRPNSHHYNSNHPNNNNTTNLNSIPESSHDVAATVDGQGGGDSGHGRDSNHSSSLLLLEKSNAVLIAIKVDRGVARDCILSMEREQRLLQILDNHAANSSFVKVRNFGSTWIAMVGFRRSPEENTSSELEFSNSNKSVTDYSRNNHSATTPSNNNEKGRRSSSRHSLHSTFRAMTFCAQAEYFANKLHLQLTIACDFGAVTAGFVSPAATHLNVFGQEVRWVMRMVDLEDWGRIIISDAFRQQLNNVKKIFSDHAGPMVEQHAHGCMWKKGYVTGLTVLSNPSDYLGNVEQLKRAYCDLISRCDRSLEFISCEPTLLSSSSSPSYELLFQSFEIIAKSEDFLQLKDRSLFTFPHHSHPHRRRKGNNIFNEIHVLLLTALYALEKNEYWVDNTSTELKQTFFERLGLKASDPIFFKLKERDVGDAIRFIEQEVNRLAVRMIWRWPKSFSLQTEEVITDELDQRPDNNPYFNVRMKSNQMVSGVEQCYSPLELLTWQAWSASWNEMVDDISSTYIGRMIIDYGYYYWCDRRNSRSNGSNNRSIFSSLLFLPAAANSYSNSSRRSRSSPRLDRVYILSNDDDNRNDNIDSSFHQQNRAEADGIELQGSSLWNQHRDDDSSDHGGRCGAADNNSEVDVNSGDESHSGPNNNVLNVLHDENHDCNNIPGHRYSNIPNSSSIAVQVPLPASQPTNNAVDMTNSNHNNSHHGVSNVTSAQQTLRAINSTAVVNTQRWLIPMSDEEIDVMRNEPRSKNIDFIKYSNDLKQPFFHVIPSAVLEIVFFAIAISPLGKQIMSSTTLSDLLFRNAFFLSFAFSQTIEQVFLRYGVIVAVCYHALLMFFFPCDILSDLTNEANKGNDNFADFGGDVIVLVFSLFRMPSLLRMHPLLAIIDAALIKSILFTRWHYFSGDGQNLSCKLLPRAKSSITLTFTILSVFFVILYYQTFISYIIEHMLLPRAKSEQEEETKLRERQQEALYPCLPLKDQPHVAQVAIYQQVPLLCIHVKALDVICEMVDCKDMAVFTTELSKIIDQSLVETGLIKVTEFSGVFIAVPAKSIGIGSDYRLSSNINCAINAVDQVQRVVSAFCSKYHFNVPLGISLHCGDVFVGFLGNDRYCFDVSGLARDMLVAMACYNGDGIFASRIFEADINRIKPADYLVHQQTVVEPHSQSQGTAESYWLCVDGTLVGMQLDDFNWICKLGEGGYGMVHLAAEKFTKVRYAIKVISLKHGRESMMSSMIKKECIILQRMSHRNVVKLHYSFISKDQLYLVMSYIKGGNLKQIIDSAQVAVHQLRGWFAELILAIEYIHSVGIIHRDIKPANCMIDTNGHLKLADFGLSKMDSNSSNGSSSSSASVNDNNSLQASIEGEGGVGSITDIGDSSSTFLSKAVRRKLQKFLPLKMARTATHNSNDQNNQQSLSTSRKQSSHSEAKEEHRSVNVLVLRRDSVITERKRALRYSNFSINILSARDETEADTLLTLNHVDAIVVEIAGSVEDIELLSPLLSLSVSSKDNGLEFEVDLAMHITDETTFQTCLGQVQRARDLVHYFCKKLFNTIPIIGLGVSSPAVTSFLSQVGAREFFSDLDTKSIPEQAWRRIFSIPRGQDMTEEEYSTIEAAASVEYSSRSLSFSSGGSSHSSENSGGKNSGGHSGKSLQFNEADNCKDSVSTLTVENRREPRYPVAVPRSNHLKGPRGSSASSRVSNSRDVANPMLNSQVEQEQIVGTLHFIAPEVIQRQCKSGIAVDWWACGLTFFYCLTKRHFFRGEDKDMVFQAILHDPIVVADALISSEQRVAGDVVQQLVCRDVYQRLLSVQMIKRHLFFEGLDWTTVSTSDQSNSYKPSQYLPKSGDPNDKAKFYGEYESQQQMLQISSYQNMYSNLQEMDMRANYSLQRYAQNKQRVRNSKKPLYSRVYGGSRQYKRELSIAQNAHYSAKMKKLLSGQHSAYGLNSSTSLNNRRAELHSLSGMSNSSSMAGLDNFGLYLNDVIEEVGEEEEDTEGSENDHANDFKHQNVDENSNDGKSLMKMLMATNTVKVERQDDDKAHEIEDNKHAQIIGQLPNDRIDDLQIAEAKSSLEGNDQQLVLREVSSGEDH